MGDLRAARPHLERGETLLLQSPGMNGELIVLRCSLVTLLEWSGDLGALSTLISRYRHDAERRNDQYLFIALASAPIAWLARGESDELQAHIEAAHALLPSDAYVLGHQWLLTAEAHRDLYLGDGAACLARVERALFDLKRTYALSIPTVRIEVFHPRARGALIEAQAGRDREAMLQIARKDARQLAGTRRMYGVALARLLEASITALSEGSEQALAKLRAAIDACDAQGLVLYAQAARVHLGTTLGGAEGSELRSRALHGLEQAGVAQPERIASVLVPGFAPVR